MGPDVRASGILVLHTPSQLDAASNLVDLLEASLALTQGAIVCSSLPGYGRPKQAPGASPAAAEQFSSVLSSVGAAIAILDAGALADPQLVFDLAAAWGQRKRVAVLLDDPALRKALPTQLQVAEIIERADRTALAAWVEDLAFGLNLTPRIGKDARRALLQLSAYPPPPVAEARTDRPKAATPDVYEALDTTVPTQDLVVDALFDSIEDPVVDADLSDLDEDTSAASAGALAAAGSELSCALSFEAGRSVADCSFHRDESEHDPLTEVEEFFGRFVDAVGGRWRDLSRMSDVEVWMEATDNLVEALPPLQKRYAHWYELGVRFATVHNIAASDPPDSAEQQQAYLELWNESIAQLGQAAMAARVSPRDVRRLQAMLENLVGPQARRDYTNVARSREELLTLAQHADTDTAPRRRRA